MAESEGLTNFLNQLPGGVGFFSLRVWAVKELKEGLAKKAAMGAGVRVETGIDTGGEEDGDQVVLLSHAEVSVKVGDQ